MKKKIFLLSIVFFFIHISPIVSIASEISINSLKTDFQISEIDDRKEEYKILLNLNNISEDKIIHNVSIELYQQNRRFYNYMIDTLFIGQSKAISISKRNGMEYIYSVINYSVDTIECSVATFLNEKMSSSNVTSNLVINTVLSLLSVIVGAFIGNYFVAKREVAKQLREDKSKINNNIREHVLIFLEEWDRTPIKSELSVKYRSLSNKIYIPNNLQLKYGDLLNILEDKNKSDKGKSFACDEFHNAFMEYAKEVIVSK